MKLIPFSQLPRKAWSDDRDKIQARVIADSVSPDNVRLTTLEVTMHRFVLAEFNTHRTFSRNSESSRAVPLHKRIDKVRNHPAMPLSFPREQKGMSGGDELTGTDRVQAIINWNQAANTAANTAERFKGLEVHKSIANRILEPYLWHTVVVTATEWDGFFHQRLHEAAQPEIRTAAKCMYEALRASVPSAIDYGGWHLPFITEIDRRESEALQGLSSTEVLKRISAARCARTSYVTHDGVRSLDKDLELYDRLAVRAPDSTDPVHWSPLEHVATPCPDCTSDNSPAAWANQKHIPPPHGAHPGNFRGWFQFRHELDVSPYV